MAPPSTADPVEVFSYAHTDEALRKKLETFLVMLHPKGAQQRPSMTRSAPP